jgi:L-ascorbate metabolism protein UlaG (beta-lactamase superfamily)
LKLRYRGHSCVEIKGRHHILIDPDFTREPDPGVEYICVTYGHRHHIGRIADVQTGTVLASLDVCEIAGRMGVPRNRLHPVKPGEKVGPVKILPGFIPFDDFVNTFFKVLFLGRQPDPGGTPLSFLVEDEISLLHIGDTHRAPLSECPDLLCLPWHTPPFRADHYKNTLIEMVNYFSPRYILPIHYDLEHTQADPQEIDGRTNAVLLNGYGWYGFTNKKLAD